MIKKCEYCGTVNYFNKTGYCKNCDRELPQKSQKSNNIIFNILDETVLETPLDFDTTVKCLMEQTGGCRETLTDGSGIGFYCEKDGEFQVRPTGDGYLCLVDGNVYTENGKTKVVIRSKKYRSQKGMIILIHLIPYIIFVALFVTLLVRKINFTVTMLDVVTVLFAILSLILSLATSHKRNQDAVSDLQIMKGEVIRRVRAIERWND